MVTSTIIAVLTVAELFISMPDSVLPYISQQQRKEIVELKKMEPDSIASYNTPLGEVRMTRMTDEILTLQLSEHNVMELGILSPDTIMLIKTYGAPTQESTCYTYTTDWKLVNTSLNEFTKVSFGDSPKVLLREMTSPVRFREEESK